MLDSFDPSSLCHTASTRTRRIVLVLVLVLVPALALVLALASIGTALASSASSLASSGSFAREYYVHTPRIGCAYRVSHSRAAFTFYVICTVYGFSV